MALVTVAHTRERQEALAVANTAGKHFYVMSGGSHVTEDDAFIGMEIKDCEMIVAIEEGEEEEVGVCGEA